MSLVVWLPLDGDLRNLGASNIEVTNNGATVDNNGKIGKCYYFDGNARYLQLSKSVGDLYSGDFSWAVWLKPTDSTRSIISSEYSSAGSSNVAFELSASRGVRIYWNGSPDIYPSNSTLPLDTWTHVAITKTTGIIKTYLNGVLRHTYTGTLSDRPSTSYIRIGDDYRGGTGVSYMGYMNDWRLYNHCLSAAEVHEIAQGLVLHYKLDNGSQEIITNIPSTNVYSYPTFNTSATGGGWNHWGPSGHSGSYGQNTDKKYIYNKNNTYSHWISEDAGTGKYNLLYQSPTFEGGYRSLQAIIKEENGLPITESICYPSWNARNGGVPNGKWTSIKDLGDGFYYCCCEGVSQDGSNDLIGIDVKPGYKIYVSECYLENNTETCSPIFTYSSNIIQDSSGYGHNGTIVGTSTSNTSTPRYNSSLSMNNTSTSNHIETDAFTLPDVISVSFWAKANKSINQVLFADPFNSIEFGFLNGLAYVKVATVAGWTTANFINNEWNHIVVEKNGSTFYLYINGTLETQNGASNYYSHNGTKLWLLNRSTNNNYAANASISDFRIYCTPLLDTDIKLLYNIGMRVDNLGGIHSFEFDENSLSSLKKQGILTNSHFSENGYQEILQYDKNIYTEPDGSTWIHIFHHNNPADGLFSSSTNWEEGIYLDSNRWYDIEKIIPNLIQYEFMIKQKTTSSATETKYRWIQNTSPLSATYADVKPGTCTYNTTSGYSSSSYGGLYILNGNTHFCIANSSNGNWYGALGCWTVYQGGIPGYPNTTVTSGYIDLYARVYLPAKIIKNLGINATEFIEI